MSIPRYRTRGGYATEQLALVQTRHNATPVTSWSTSPSKGTYETMSDTVNPGFVPGVTISNNAMVKVREDRGFIPATGADHTVFAGPYTNGAVLSETGSISLGDFTSTFDDILKSSDFSFQHVLTQAATAALASVKKPDVNGLVTLGEMNSTLQTLRHPLTHIVNILDIFLDTRVAPKSRRRRANTRFDAAVREYYDARTQYRFRAPPRRFRGKGERYMAELADQHLAVIFGIMPFVNEVRATLKVLRDDDSRLPERFTARGKATDHHRTEIVQVTNPVNNADTITTKTVNISVGRAVTARAYVLYEHRFTIAEQLGISVDQVPSAVWQMMTLSFVVDWFVNVGQVISALTPKIGVRTLCSGMTIDEITDCTAAGNLTVSNKTNRGWTGGFYGFNQTRLTTVKRRETSGLEEHVKLAFKTNSHKPLLDTGKISSLISLVIQKLTRLG